MLVSALESLMGRQVVAPPGGVNRGFAFGGAVNAYVEVKTTSFWNRVREGDPDATDELEREVARTATALFRKWFVPRYAHEECRNDALSRVWERVRDGVEPQNIGAFLWPQLQGAVTTWIRRTRSRPSLPTESLEIEPAVLAEPAHVSDLADLRLAIEECASSIRNERARRAWTLRYATEPPTSATEVAKIMEAPRGTVLGWWKEATDKLRSCLERKGFRP